MTDFDSSENLPGRNDERGEAPFVSEKADTSATSPDSLRIGDPVKIVGGYAHHRGLVGTLERLNSGKLGWCFVRSGNRRYSCRVSDLISVEQQCSGSPAGLNSPES